MHANTPSSIFLTLVPLEASQSAPSTTKRSPHTFFALTTLSRLASRRLNSRHHLSSAAPLLFITTQTHFNRATMPPALSLCQAQPSPIRRLTRLYPCPHLHFFPKAQLAFSALGHATRHSLMSLRPMGRRRLTTALPTSACGCYHVCRLTWQSG